jgi:hypothetical protein
MRSRPPVSPEEETHIVHLYQGEMMTIEAIAAHVVRSSSTVFRVLKSRGIPRHPRVTEQKIFCSDAELARMYTVDLMDSYEISRLFDVCPETIMKRLKSAGVKPRSPGLQGAMLRSGERGLHGLSGHPLYQAWNAMVHRCHSPSNKHWDDYGGLGVTVCDRWRDRSTGFARFLEDMGERPPGTSLDRIDPFGNYEPSNCRWATLPVQASNKRGSRERVQQMVAEIAMWRERALRAEKQLAELSSGRSRQSRTKKAASGETQGDQGGVGGALAITLFDLAADDAAA